MRFWMAGRLGRAAGEGHELPPADHAVGRLEQSTRADQRLQLFVDAVLQQQRKVVGTLAQLQLGQLVLACQTMAQAATDNARPTSAAAMLAWT